jgi:hypothetical protein
MLHELVLFLLCNRIAIVSSKTKESKKVFTLHLSREALLKNPSSKNSEHTWKVSFSLQFLLFCYFTCCKLQSRLDQYPLDCRLLEDLGVHLKRRSCCHHIKVLPRWTTFWMFWCPETVSCIEYVLKRNCCDNSVLNRKFQYQFSRIYVLT